MAYLPIIVRYESDTNASELLKVSLVSMRIMFGIPNYT